VREWRRESVLVAVSGVRAEDCARKITFKLSKVATTPAESLRSRQRCQQRESRGDA